MQCKACCPLCVTLVALVCLCGSLLIPWYVKKEKPEVALAPEGVQDESWLDERMNFLGGDVGIVMFEATIRNKTVDKISMFDEDACTAFAESIADESDQGWQLQLPCRETRMAFMCMFWALPVGVFALCLHCFAFGCPDCCPRAICCLTAMLSFALAGLAGYAFVSCYLADPPQVVYQRGDTTFILGWKLSEGAGLAVLAAILSGIAGLLSMCCVDLAGASKKKQAYAKTESDGSSDYDDLQVSHEDAKMFLKACEEEYINGVNGAVEDFFVEQGVNDEDREAFCQVEDEIRDSAKKRKMIQHYRTVWGV
eukprot:TRINITY_DN74460_c0_g1_i1.p1 TRINITY_DN74460_c0_g1~~TRINITY_DN74460_c0_g1_i1.p1  ORF type:complete len:310 (-),score=57.84 TRINITY_DN74460_c0_g1_i1:148-1077(-)